MSSRARPKDWCPPACLHQHMDKPRDGSPPFDSDRCGYVFFHRFTLTLARRASGQFPARRCKAASRGGRGPTNVAWLIDHLPLARDSGNGTIGCGPIHGGTSRPRFIHQGREPPGGGGFGILARGEVGWIGDRLGINFPHLFLHSVTLGACPMIRTHAEHSVAKIGGISGFQKRSRRRV